MADAALLTIGAPATGTLPGLRNPCDHSRTIKAVLFDVDGTLYRQAPLRMLMALELLTLPLTGPFRAPKRWRTLAGYRRAQETLRAAGHPRVTGHAQLAAAAATSGLPVNEVERLVDEWMLQRPLKYLRFVRAAGLRPVLDLLDRTGVRAGILTDYPPLEKLRALGIAERFSPVLCATDADIGCFKPHPRGFLRACERWGLLPQDVLMVGDRIDVDAAGAAAAGMPSVIIGRPHGRVAAPPNCLLLPSFERLHDVLDSCN